MHDKYFDENFEKGMSKNACKSNKSIQNMLMQIAVVFTYTFHVVIQAYV